MGDAIVLLAVAALVAACVRNLWRDAKSGGCSGCAGCGGCHGNACSRCAGFDGPRLNPETLADLRIKKE